MTTPTAPGDVERDGTSKALEYMARQISNERREMHSRADRLEALLRRALPITQRVADVSMEFEWHSAAESVAQAITDELEGRA